MKPAPSAARFFRVWPGDCTGVFQIPLRSAARTKNASPVHAKFAMRFARALRCGATKCAPLKQVRPIRFRSDKIDISDSRRSKNNIALSVRSPVKEKLKGDQYVWSNCRFS